MYLYCTFFSAPTGALEAIRAYLGSMSVYVCTICIRESNRRLFAVKSVAHGRGDVIM